jgi:phosphoglucosamine mutase
MQRLVVDTDAVAGFAFDGDADRVLACGSDGVLIDGDQIIAMAAADRLQRGALASDTVVITVMTNLGFRLAMTDLGINIVETPVGDRHVLVALDEGGFSLGGEQSGHIIHRDLATTGDGVLSAVQLLDAALRRDVDLGEWAGEVMTRFPQVLQNVRVDRRVDNVDELLEDAIAAEEQLLGDSGRILIRASGTEPLVRVMVEAADRDTAESVATRLSDTVRRTFAA